MSQPTRADRRASAGIILLIVAAAGHDGLREDAPAAMAAAFPGALDPSAVPRLDLNQGSRRDLAAIPGLGATLAGRIVAWRDLAGPFADAWDMTRVPGAGPAKLRRLARFIEVRTP